MHGPGEGSPGGELQVDTDPEEGQPTTHTWYEQARVVGRYKEYSGSRALAAVKVCSKSNKR